MKAFGGLLVGACLALVVACAAGKSSMSAPQTAPTTEATPAGIGVDGGNARDRILELEIQIDQQIAQLGLPPTPPPACPNGNCSASAAEPMTVTPSAQDTTCKPGKSETCTQSCTLSDSICDNAGKICELAKELGGDDNFANEKCTRGKASCQASRTRCCGCL